MSHELWAQYKWVKKGPKRADGTAGVSTSNNIWKGHFSQLAERLTAEWSNVVQENVFWAHREMCEVIIEVNTVGVIESS